MSTNETSTDTLVYPESSFGQNAKNLFKRTAIPQNNSFQTNKDNNSKLLFSPSSQHSNRDEDEAITKELRKFDFNKATGENILKSETDKLNDTGLIPRTMIVKPSDVPLLDEDDDKRSKKAYMYAQERLQFAHSHENSQTADGAMTSESFAEKLAQDMNDIQVFFDANSGNSKPGISLFKNMKTSEGVSGKETAEELEARRKALYSDLMRTAETEKKSTTLVRSKTASYASGEQKSQIAKDANLRQSHVKLTKSNSVESPKESPRLASENKTKIVKNTSTIAWPKPPKTDETSPVPKSIASTKVSTTKNDFKRSPLQQKPPTPQDNLAKKPPGSFSDRESSNLSLTQGMSEDSDNKAISVRRCINFEDENMLSDIAGLHKEIHMMKSAILSRGLFNISSPRSKEELESKPKSQEQLEANRASPSSQKGILSNRDSTPQNKSAMKNVKFQIPTNTVDNDKDVNISINNDKDNIQISDDIEVVKTVEPVSTKNQFIKRKLKSSQDTGGQKPTNINHSKQDQTKNPYQSLNEKGFHNHSEYLYERALVQKKNRQIKQEDGKRIKEKEELRGCTFSPETISVCNTRDNIITRTKKWEIAREKQLVKNKVAVMEKELAACTFYPNNVLENFDPKTHNFDNFLKRNNEWSQKRSPENRAKDEEISRVPKSPSRKIESSASKKVDNKITNHQNQFSASSINFVTSVQPTRVTKEHPKLAKNPLDNAKSINSSHKKEQQKIRPTMNKLELERLTSPSLSTHENQLLAEQNIKADISESYRLLDKLKEAIQETEKKTEARHRAQTQNINSRLKTTGEQFLKHNKSVDNVDRAINRNYNTRFLLSQRNTPSPIDSRRQSREFALTSSQIDPRTLKATDYNVVMKQNKYYAVQKGQKRYPKTGSLVLSPQATTEKSYPLSARGSAQKEKGILTKRGSLTTPQKTKKKVVINISENKEYPVDFSHSRKVQTTKASSGTKKINIPVKPDLHYVTSDLALVLSKPMQVALDHKYAELLGQAEKVTRQLENLNQLVYNSVGKS